jgi:hypothetical protein
MSANPVVLIVLAILALGAVLVLAYNKVGWFRDAVDAAFRFIGRVIGFVVDWVKDNWELMLAGMLGPLGVAIALIVHHWDKVKAAIGWVVDKVVDLWNKTEPARSLLADLGDIGLTVLKDAIGWVVDKLQWLIDNGGKVAGFVGDVVGAVGSVVPGDTPRPRAVASAHRAGRGSYHARAGARANLARSMAVHRAIDGRVPGRRVVTSSLRSWALGSPGSDHGTGRAYDLKGSNLNHYAREVRAAGGFAEHHGSGAGRHLHVAVGDTPRPRARVSAGASSDDAGTLIVIEPGAIVVHNPASAIDLEEAIAAGIARYDRDRRERGARR